MAGQGVLYIQLKAGLEFCYKSDSEDESDFLFSRVNEEVPPAVSSQVSSSSQNIHSDTNMNQEDSVLSSSVNKTEQGDESTQLINDIKEKNLQTPVEILKFLQKIFVKGRPLDIADINTSPEGETNYICVDRENILQSTFAELESITDYRVTFEVDFLGEMAKDYGGPRKEWIALAKL